MRCRIDVGCDDGGKKLCVCVAMSRGGVKMFLVGGCDQNWVRDGIEIGCAMSKLGVRCQNWVCDVKKLGCDVKKLGSKNMFWGAKFRFRV